MNKQNINPDLQAERLNPSFNLSKMTEYLYGGIENWNQAKQISELFNFFKKTFNYLIIDFFVNF